jgi:hypothetical protein
MDRAATFTTSALRHASPQLVRPAISSKPDPAFRRYVSSTKKDKKRSAANEGAKAAAQARTEFLLKQASQFKKRVAPPPEARPSKLLVPRQELTKEAKHESVWQMPNIPSDTQTSARGSESAVVQRLSNNASPLNRVRAAVTGPSYDPAIYMKYADSIWPGDTHILGQSNQLRSPRSHQGRGSR